MKHTKIICTIGPACDDETVLTAMIRAGMNVARLNFSHGSHAEHKARIDRIKRLREKLRAPLPLMLDTKGPEYRVGTFRGGIVALKQGGRFTFTARDIEGDENRVSVSWPGLAAELDVGDVILVNDGLVKLAVREKTGTDLICETLIGGEISDRKSMSFPGKTLSQPYLSNRDREDLLFGIANGVDYVACSFVSSPRDVETVRAFLDANGGGDIGLIAKIENRAGADSAEAILKRCDGLMIARGDLGVEIPYAELPAIQKRLTALAGEKGGVTVTATEMLESMTSKPRPTRAEISDVANAVFDGTDAVMLSGETAAGQYPVEAVRAMSDIITEAEKDIDYAAAFDSHPLSFQSAADALAHAACQLAVDTNAAAVAAVTSTGRAAALAGRFRPPCPILGVTTEEKAYHKMALNWNVLPVLAPAQTAAAARAAAKDALSLSQGASLILIADGEEQGSNLIRLETIE